MLDPKKQLEAMKTLIGTLQGSAFYGEAVVNFNHGNIVRVQLTQSLKLGEDDGSKKTPKQTNANSQDSR